MCRGSINQDQFSSLKKDMCFMDTQESSSGKILHYNYPHSNLFIDMHRTKSPFSKFN